MFSTEANRNADACRFCWMCRHVCPVGNVTGHESHTPRARGLLASMMERGECFDNGMAEIMYKCCLCDACANDCATGYLPSIFIREARTNAVAEGIEPPLVTAAIERIQATGNIFGATAVAGELASAIAGLPQKADVLVYLGETALYRQPESAIALFSLLKKAGVAFTALKKEPASGAYLSDITGFVGEVQEMARRVDAAIQQMGAATLIALNPHDAVMLSQEYPQWGLLQNIRVVTATAYVADLVKENRLLVKKGAGSISLHDPCKLTRGMDESEPVREILKAMGYEIQELFLNKKLTRCCGGEVFNAYDPETEKLVALNREADALRLGIHTVATACPDCIDLLTQHSEGGVQYLDVFCLLDKTC